MRWDDLVIRAEWKSDVLEYVDKFKPEDLKEVSDLTETMACTFDKMVLLHVEG